MDTIQAIDAFTALAQMTRLATFKRLASREPQGICAGELARLAGVPQNTMSAHLSVLARTRLIDGKRSGRSIIYRANFEQLQALISFLVKDCCDGRPDLCAPILAELVQHSTFHESHP